MKKLQRKDLVCLAELSSQEVAYILDTAIKLKKQVKKKGHNKAILKNKVLAMVFEKSSLRTRVTFEVAMMQLGGQAIYLSQQNFKIGERETASDVARNLERWVDAIMIRSFAHSTVTDMASHASIPVINGLSDSAHPCQALADVLTIKEEFGSLSGLKVAFIGDGNNVAASLAYACAHTGMHFVCASPEGYELPAEVVQRAELIGRNTGSSISLLRSPEDAAAAAHCLYTDVWTSMGQESEKERRLHDFQGYQVNAALLEHASSNAIILHCLPAHRGEEISSDAMDSPASRIFDQAENRLHAQKAVLALLV